MKKKNKVISLIVVLSLCFSFTVIPANAVNPYAVVRPPDVGDGESIYNGTFFIKNCHFNKFITIDDSVSDSTPSAHMELWGFTGGNDQKFQISYVGDGYYKFISVASGLALAVKSGYSNTGGADIEQEAYTGDSRQLWSISQTSRGTLVFRPKSSSNQTSVDWCMSIGETAGDGIEERVEQWGYSNNSVYTDEWVLCSIDYTVVNLDVLYDNAYINRYPDAFSKIIGMLETLQDKYFTEFGIYINYSTPTLFVSYGDTCSTNPTQICTHADDTQCQNSPTASNLKTYHHKNIYNILRRVSAPNTSITLKAVFIGHDTCVIKNSIHQPSRTYGMAFTNRGYVAVMNFSSSASELKTLVHEINHLYGVLDHYDIDDVPSTQEIIDETGNNGYSEYCIHGEKKENSTVLDNLIICDGCKSILQANRTRYDHH